MQERLRDIKCYGIAAAELWGSVRGYEFEKVGLYSTEGGEGGRGWMRGGGDCETSTNC